MNEFVLALASAVVGFSIGFVICALFGKLEDDRGGSYGEQDIDPVKHPYIDPSIPWKDLK